MPHDRFMCRAAFFASLSPLAQSASAFYLVLGLVVELIEEVESRDFFHVVHGAHIIVHVVMSRLVVVYKAYGLRVVRRPLGSHYDLEESVGHGNTMLANGVVALAVEYWACHDVNLAVEPCPDSAGLLKVFPVALVQVAVLRTDVGHQKRLFLSLV